MILPESCTDEGIKNNLLLEARTGNRESREKLIEMHMRYVATMAMNHRPYRFRDEFASVALEALVLAIDSLIAGNATNWKSIATRVRGALIDYVPQQNLFSCSRRTWNRADGVVPVCSMYDFQEHEAFTSSHDDSPPTKYDASKATIYREDKRIGDEVAEIISRICVTPEEETILNMLLAGYTGEEISTEMKIERSLVSRVRVILRGRYSAIKV